jgi:probable rRNA maturation factor
MTRPAMPHARPFTMEPPSTERIELVNRSGRRIPGVKLRRAVAAVLAQHDRAGAPVAVLLTDDEEIRGLNREYRGLDEATDVLTFPAGDFPADIEDAPLGDVAISVPYAERQAAERGVALGQELGFLAIHGALHLIGFDDETEADRRLMVEQMNRAAVAAGLRPDEAWASLLHGVDR